MTQTLTLDFQTATLNALLDLTWRGRARLKRSDRELVWGYARAQGVTSAMGRRRVTLTVVLGPGQRGGDPDCFWKSLLDAMTAACLITDDNRQGVELMPVEYTRGPTRGMVITLEDVEGCR